MSDEPVHSIVGTEAILAHVRFTIDEDGNPVHSTPDLVDLIDPGNDQYECTCGVDFGHNWDAAMDHLRDMRLADDSEGTVLDPKEVIGDG